jgi:alanyl-tRNA synthetase
MKGWSVVSDEAQTFVGYQTVQVQTEVLAYRTEDGVLGLQLRENPFYAESGGQVSDGGEVRGSGWTLQVEDVRKVEGRTAVFGSVDGDFPERPEVPLIVEGRVPRDVRHDTERNHTATHLLHAALRRVLGQHVVQRGSLVAPDRLRFDFAHPEPMTREERERVEAIVNEGIWADHPVEISQKRYADAVKAGAMALFGEKYGDEVRVVRVPEVSMELCGGTHVRHTGEIGLVRLVGESGVAAGVRRIEALTGPRAFDYLKERERRLEEAAEVLRTQPENLVHRAEQLRDERYEVERLLDELRREGGSGETALCTEVLSLDGGGEAEFGAVRLRARGADDARKWGDAFLASGRPGVALLGAEMPGDKRAIFAFVTEDLISRGVRADRVVRTVATMVGGKGGGRPHMAQAGVEDPERLDEALVSGAEIVRRILAGDGS